MQHNTAADFARYPLQLGRLLGDPLLGLWIDQDRLEAFCNELLEVMDPASARIAEAEASWIRMRHNDEQKGQ